MVALPAAPSLDHLSWDGAAAYAKGGNGNGGGNGGDGPGNSGGHGQGPGSGASASAPGHDGTPPGQSGVSGFGHGVSANSHGLTAASLGSLNAANSSQTAKDVASLNSPVGQLGLYSEAMSEDPANVDAAAQALAAAANKEIDFDVVDAVNGIMGIEADVDTTQAVADAAAEVQAEVEP